VTGIHHHAQTLVEMGSQERFIFAFSLILLFCCCCCFAVLGLKLKAYTLSYFTSPFL
jgi:hypothetical protein